MRTRNWILTALTLLMLLFYHSFLKLYYTTQVRDAPGDGGKSPNNGGEDAGFAYVFYVTADLYACSALVNIQRLRALGSTIPIHVLASEYLSIPYMDALEAANVTVHIEETPHSPLLMGSYYEDCLLKLVAFKLHRLDPGLKRVLVFDSDQLLLKNFDHLFSDLPVVDLAAPRAYWLPPGKAVFSSAFMMITLSDRLWEKVNQTLPRDDGLVDDGPTRADMDILNDELGDTAMILSGEYVTLNSHWADWSIPKWFRPEDAPPPNRTGPGPPSISELTREPLSGPQADLKVRDEYELPVADLEPAPRFPEHSEISQQLVQLYDYTSIVHFTSLGKPWSYNVQEVLEEQRDAHPLFAVQFGMWRKIAREVCPDDWVVT